MAGKQKNTNELFITHLQHPLFQIPVLSFIEEHCIIFSPDVGDCDEYRKIHKEYQTIVTGLLDGFRVDLGVTHEAFVAAITEIDQSKQGIRMCFKGIEQVLAVDDFLVFVQMMQKINQELQEQAMAIIQQLILQGGGRIPTTQSNEISESEDDVIAMVMRISKEEYENELKQREKEAAEIDKATLESKCGIDDNRTAPKVDIPPPKQNSKKTNVEISARMRSAKLSVGSRCLDTKDDEPLHSLESLPTVSKPSTVGLEASSPLTPPQQLPVVSDTSLHAAPLLAPRVPSIGSGQKEGSQSAAAAWLANAQQENTSMNGSGDHTGPSSLSREERQRFLREQRDKLMAKKRSEREKQLKEVEQAAKTSRPVSARVARSMINNSTPPTVATNEEDEKKLAMRRAIAAKLKAEVVDK